MKQDSLLIVADSERDANLLYAVGCTITDPFVYLRLKDYCLILVPDIGLSRIRRLVRDCEVHSLSTYPQRPKKQRWPLGELAPAIHAVLRDHGVNKLSVPPSFPLALARDLKNLKIKLMIHEGPIFPEREVKTSTEIKKISATLTMAEVGLAEGLLALRNASVGRDRRLTYHNAPLTAEKLRAIIDTAILQAGGKPNHSIVACGRQSSDPKEAGHGYLRANEPIIIDVFPRSRKTGYHADITRTIVKGRASEYVRRLHDTVRRAHELAFTHLKAATSARKLHQKVQQFFEHEGFPTRCEESKCEGFFRSTGHGLGLELHETPLISADSTDQLRRGQVIALQPALYYRNVGGVRIEDVVLVTANGAKNLTKFEKTLEL